MDAIIVGVKRTHSWRNRRRVQRKRTGLETPSQKCCTRIRPLTERDYFRAVGGVAG
jgi:hypothetical protein